MAEIVDPCLEQYTPLDQSSINGLEKTWAQGGAPSKFVFDFLILLQIWRPPPK